jgi:trigger factor
MQITRKDIDNLNAQLNISLTPEDYKEQFENELIKQSKKVQIKGFRKGKVPKSYMKKAYGQSVLVDTVFSKVNDVMVSYISDNKLRLLGRPLPNDEQEQVNFDPMSLETYNFSFDIGLEPEFELVGVGEKDSYKKPIVKATQEMIDEEMGKAQTRMGKEVEVESGVEENDRIELTSVELEDGKEKEGGVKASVKLLVNMVADKKVKKNLLKGKVGDEIEFDPFKLEKDSKPGFVKKQILGIEDENVEVNNTFKGTIESIKRISPAELNEEFFTQLFGPEVTTLEKAEETLRGELEKFYSRQGEALMFRSFQDTLMEKTNFEMPEAFLKRWLISESKEGQDDATIEEGFAGFIRGLRWTLIRDRIANQGKIEVTEEEIYQYFMVQVQQYMGGYGADENLLRHTASRLMQDQEQINKAHEAIKDDKVFDYIKTLVKVKEEAISAEELEKRIAALRK